MWKGTGKKTLSKIRGWLLPAMKFRMNTEQVMAKKMHASRYGKMKASNVDGWAICTRLNIFGTRHNM